MNAMSDTVRRLNVVQELQKRLKHGQTIYTVVRKTNRAGTGRLVSLLVVRNREIIDITSSVATATQRHWEDGGIWTSSPFDLVQQLSFSLHGYEGKGKGSNAPCHAVATKDSFKAGYTFEHKAL